MSGSFTFILAYLTTRQDITESYFHLGMHYKEILLLIDLTHGFYFSMRQLKRILKSRGLGRRKNRSSLREVGGCIKMELCGSGNTINDPKTLTGLRPLCWQRYSQEPPKNSWSWRCRQISFVESSCEYNNIAMKEKYFVVNNMFVINYSLNEKGNLKSSVIKVRVSY